MRFPWVWRRTLERAQREALSLVMRTVRYKGELQAAKAEALRLDHLLAKRTEELAEAREAGVKLEARAVQAEAALGKVLKDTGATVVLAAERLALFQACLTQLLEAGSGVLKVWPDARALPVMAGRDELRKIGGATIAVTEMLTRLAAFEAKVAEELKRAGSSGPDGELAAELKLGGFAAAVMAASSRPEEPQGEGLKAVVGGVN